MADIKQAIEYAKKNPSSPFATELRKRIESGQMNSELQAAGLNTPEIAGVPKKESFVEKAKETFGDIKTVVTDSIKSEKDGINKLQEINQDYKAGEINVGEKKLQQVGAVASAGSEIIGNLFKGAGNVLLSDKHEKQISEVITKYGSKIMAVPQVQEIINKYNSLPENQQKDIDAVGGIVSLVSEFVGMGAAGKVKNVAKQGIENALETTVDVAKAGANNVSKNTAVSGITQTVKDLGQRIPKTIERVRDFMTDAKVRAEKIRNAPPEIKNALKNNLDESIINTVSEADDVTREAYKQVLDIAEESPNKIGAKKQPTIVGGELAAQQFDLINKQKQAVGKQIGDAVAQLSKTTTVDINPAKKVMEEILDSNGIKTLIDEDGVRFDFSNSPYTTAERARITELYKLATEGADAKTPLDIYKKNQLFSKLQRESKFEGLSDILVDTPDGKQNLFSVFRDIYANTLDEVSPENIRALNKQYAELANLTDDIENSIFKTPDFAVTKSLDPAEFAKVNLRRIFGESQSSPVFEGIADAMDAASRGLGYNGASPKAVAEFAQEMRKLFPETIPKTGFTGGIKAGFSDIIEAVTKVGAPNARDKQKALRKLLEDLSNKNQK